MINFKLFNFIWYCKLCLFVVKKDIGLLLCIFYTLFIMTTKAVNANNEFATNLFQTIVSKSSEQNVIFSPVSIQSCLAMSYLGAKGDTAEELRTGLKLGNGDTRAVATQYGSFLTKAFQNHSDKAPVLKLANRIYVNDGLKINGDVRALLQKDFQTDIEQLPFLKSSQAIAKINNWVEQSTNGQIRNLMGSGSVDGDTNAIFVNAIYFKGSWKYPFYASRMSNYSKSAQHSTQVSMMYNEDRFSYAELPELDATAIELPYTNSDMSMLIVLPNKVDGLREMERNLANLDLNRDIMPKLKPQRVDVFLPKFKIEYETDLKGALQKLGIKKLFTNGADLSGFFDDLTPNKVSDIKHKAFLDVNEQGTEAAAATYYKIVTTSLPLFVKEFRADHPFVFAIRNTEAIFYAGHVIDI